MSRADTILSRFPAHFEATKPGKLLGAVTAALTRDLDAQFSQMGGIRRAHRLREAWTDHDLLALAALHRIRAGELALLHDRLDAAEALAEALKAADDAGRDDAATALLALFSLDLPDPALAAFGDPGDPAAAATALAEAVHAAARPKERRKAMVTRIHQIARIHLAGNGTVGAVLHAAANALDLDVIRVEHSEDRYWHAAEVTDRLRPLVDAASGLSAPSVTPEVLGIEENPLRRGSQPPEQRDHGECFDLMRKGFDPAPMEITVTGEGQRAVGPVIVNRDQGRGVGFTGAVPPGETLTFTENGRVLLGGSDVTALSFGFDGGVFADRTRQSDRDVGFDDAHFVITTPGGALDRGAGYPHAGPSLPMPEIGIGVTRMAFFVQEGHFARAETAADPTPVTPRHKAGIFVGPGAPQGAVFAATAPEPPTPAALVAFSWAEHQAYRARVILPPRFSAMDPAEDGAEDGAGVARRVIQALDRVRPVGVTLEVGFAEEQWILGAAALPPDATEDGESNGDGDADAPPSLIDQLAGSTVLWPAPEEDPDEPSDEAPIDADTPAPTDPS